MMREQRLPQGCKCDPSSWNLETPVDDICEEFEDCEAGFCAECAHDKECHD